MGDLANALMVIESRARFQRILSSLLTDKPAGMSGDEWRRAIGDAHDGLTLARGLFDEIMPTMRNSDFAKGIDDLTLEFSRLENGVPQSAGVYLLFNVDNCALDYIGKSNNLRRRPFYSHQYFDRTIHVAGYILDDKPAALEAKLIRLNRPRLNIVIPHLIEPPPAKYLGDVIW